MSKVSITTTLLDGLADAIAAKTGESTPMSIADMTDTVDGITSRDSTDLSASGATVSVPAGYYQSAASKAVASGSVTASATKGSVSNHSVQITPSASVTAGYISSGATGTPVTVQASELVSGNIAITSNTATGQSLDVSQYATATVNVPTGGGATVATKSVTASNRPSSLAFSSLSGQPKMFALKATFTMTSSSTTYYYVDSMRGYLENNAYSVQGRLFQMGSTRQTVHVTSGYSASWSGNTLTLTSTGSRTASPGCFYNGSYELVYVY